MLPDTNYETFAAFTCYLKSPISKVMIMRLLYSSALMSERIKCSIPLVDNHINIHCTIYAVC